MAAFLGLEERFARQARLTVLVARLSGLWMIWRLDLWARFGSVQFWWMHAMVGVWAVFTAMLYLVEPFILRRRGTPPAAAFARLETGTPPAAAFARLETMHRLMLLASLVAAGGAVAGSHGLG